MEPSAYDDAARQPAVDSTTGLLREVAATPQQASILRRVLADWVREHGVLEPIAGDITLAAYEAMANVVDHAYPVDPDGTMILSAAVEPGFLTVTVTDNGQWNDDPANPIRGRGIPIIRALTPEASITNTPTGTTVRMTWPWTCP